MTISVLYVHQYFNTRHMSGGTRSYELAHRLVGSGYKVTMLTADRTKTFGLARHENIDGIHVIWIPGAYNNRYGNLRKILSFGLFSVLSCFYALFLKFDVVFATSTPLTVGLPALLAKKIRRKPYVFEVRDLWPEMPIAVGALKNKRFIYVLRWLERTIYKNATALIGLSPGMSQGIRDILQKTGVSRPVYDAPNSCDFDVMCAPTDPDYIVRRQSMRAKLGLRDDQTMLLYAGTFGILNDLDYLLSLARQTKDDASFIYVVVGGGVKDDELRAAISGENLHNVMVIGRVNKTAIADYFAACDIGMSLFIAIPEMEKNSANKFFDTLAAGKPIILNYGGWQQDFIEKYQIGIQLSRDAVIAESELTTFTQGLHNITVEQILTAADMFSREKTFITVKKALDLAHQPS